MTGDLAAAVSGIWDKFRGVTLERVAALDEAALAQLGGELEPELRRRAEREAHKLAGSVGTFGFSRGSELAREAELMLAGNVALSQAQTLRLSELAVSLRRELEQSAPAPAAPPRSGPEGRRLLLIIDEDQEFTDRVTMEAEGRGLEAIVAPRMSEVRAALAGRAPDAILLDPLFGGSEEVGMRLLAELTTRAPERPVLLASWSVGLSSRLDAARLGAHVYLQKPIPPAQVVEQAQSALQRVETSGRVLALDDDPRILELVRVLLSGTGLEVHTLDDPRRFWDLIETLRPDVVVLDVDMPHIDGVELCRVLRNDTRWATLPVIFLTARTDADSVQRIFAAGADDYVAKPIAGPELTTRVQNRLERVRLYQMLADTDALTGVGNRRKSEENITQLMSLAGRQKQPLTLAVVDLDHFKRINDRFGHAAGDEVLRRVSKRLRNALRGEDVIGRWGGEEFVIGAYGASKAVLQRRLGEVLAAIREEGIVIDGESHPISFSAGVAEFPTDGGDLTTLYRLADAALYEAKAQGRERIVASGMATSATAGSATQRQEVDVALVEDDPVLAELLLHALATHGYSTVWLADGETAVARLAGADPNLRARVTLLDVNLPGRDGLAVLRDLARAGVTARSRVIMLTVRSTEAEVVRSLEMGAFDHVAKPFSVPVLLRRLQTALARS